MRNRINKNLAFTTSESQTKKNYIKNNKPKKIKFLMTVFGKQKKIAYSEYLRLLKAGYDVDIVEE